MDQIQQDIATYNKEINKITIWLQNKPYKIKDINKEIEQNTQDQMKYQNDLKQIQLELKEIETLANDILIQIEQQDEQLQQIKIEIDQFDTQYIQLEEELNDLKQNELMLQHEYEEQQHKCQAIQQKLLSWQEKLDQMIENIQANDVLQAKQTVSKHNNDQSKHNDESNDSSSSSACSYQLLSDKDLELLNIKDLEYSIAMYHKKLDKLSPDMKAINVYYQKEKEYIARVKQLDQVTTQRDLARLHYDELKKKRLDLFMSGFTMISMKLKEMYQMLTLGGDAELELVDSLDPFAEGVLFSVRPFKNPEKIYKIYLVVKKHYHH